MAKDGPIADVVLHPVRLRIVQQLGGRTLTTAQLRAALPDVTQATLYRHVAALIEAEVIAVVEERRVRGAVERTLALGERMAHVDQVELRRMSDAQLRAAFLAFLGDLAGDFDRFLDSGDAELRDYLGFGRGPLYVTTEDLATIQAGLAELLAPYLSDPGDGRRRLSLATILLPEADTPDS
ncbi:helix-turn-helix domain-containing protein [Aeromicrobium sp. YIM 150415]|uniref:helix-turn-helix domain-containing protein n=1 Tax=Aeromicrobium sp. YIM 150415 TaxID=2803912 RepID=UPI00196518E0|nr:helix-turn-helix domain-containing protein [Aeromicrobium sp. YIM 150415]MBM9463441.1 helix-turn-helix domain-containing protein [Aeromicrobium sp. YIM 150415]